MTATHNNGNKHPEGSCKPNMPTMSIKLKRNSMIWASTSAIWRVSLENYSASRPQLKCSLFKEASDPLHSHPKLPIPSKTSAYFCYHRVQPRVCGA